MTDTSGVRVKMWFQNPTSREGTEHGWLGDLLVNCPAIQVTVQQRGFWPLLLQWHPSLEASVTFPHK